MSIRIQNITGNFLNSIRKIFIISFFGCLFLFTGVIAALQLPTVQKAMVNYVTIVLARYVNYPIEIEGVSINWLSHLVLHNVVVRDTKRLEMIKVDEIEADFRLLSLMGKDVIIKEVNLTNPHVNVKWYKEIDDINISNFIYSLTHIGKDRNENSLSTPHIGRYKEFIVKKVTVKNGYFQYEKTGSSKLNDRFDFSNFELKKIHLTASGFKIVSDTISMNIKGLNCIDKSTGLKVHAIDADFKICEKYMKLENLDARIGNSHIKDRLTFEYNGFGQLSDIQDSVLMAINFNKSIIKTEDVACFIPDIKGFKEEWMVSGLLKGKFTDMRISNLDLYFGKQSNIKGNAAFKGLPKWENTLMSLDLENSLVYYNDLEKYGLKPYRENLYKFNKVAFCGNFSGYPNHFKTNGEFNTDLGFVKTDFTMRLADDNSKGAYEGVLQIKDFDAQKFFNKEDVKKISGNFRIEGEGFELEGLRFNMNAFIENIGYKDYVYNNIISNVRWKKNQFIGTLDVKDSNLIADIIAKIDFDKEKRTIDIDAGLKKIDLYNLKLYHKPLSISSRLKIHTEGFDYKNIEAEIECNQTEFFSTLKSFKIDTLSVYYHKSDNKNRKLMLISDALDFTLNGNFEIRELWSSVFSLSKEVNNSFSGSDTILTHKKLPLTILSAEYEANFKNSAALFELFLPDISLSSGSRVWGGFNSHYKKSLALNADVADFRYKNTSFKDNRLKFYVTKSGIEKDISSVFLLKSSKQAIENKLVSENLYIHNSWVNETMDFEFLVKQAESTNEAKLIGNILLRQNGEKEIKFSSAMIKLLDDDWKIDSNNIITLKDKFISFKNFELKNSDQKIFINGELSDKSDEELIIDVKNFDLTNLNKLVGKKLEGRLNGYVTIKDYFKDLKINSEVTTDKLKINKLFIGNILANSKWDNEHSRLEIKTEIERNGLKMFDLYGNYTPNPVGSEDKLNLTAILNRTSLVVVEPFISDILSDIGGEATGHISIKGDLLKPVFNGEIDVSGGRVKINYLNTSYLFDEKILFKQDGFILNDIVLNDEHGGLAVIEGGIYHDNFKDFRIKLSGVYKNAEILNTTQENNNLYYGKVIATGNFSINGNFNFLDIKVDAQTRKGTRIYIPNNNSADVEKQEYIKFIKKKDPEKPKKESLAEETANSLKINLELNIDITADAYNEFILNPVAGDRIGGYGSGRLRLEYYTDGEFNMYGLYTFERESNYIFTFLNIANKKFSIRRGSTVSWNGSPYNGIIDVTASYDDRVSFHPLVDTTYWNRAGIRTPYPVSTILYLKGDLMKPTISYDIQLTNYPAVISGVPLFNYVSAFENRIRNNVNDMNTQVFSLLVFRKFLYGTSELVGAADGTVSELLTNQLSQLISQIDENLQVDFKMNGFNRDAFNAVQVRVSYELLDGKIRITRSGGFTNNQSQATTASIIGDVSVEYMLTDDGKFRLKGFTKNNPNVLASSSGSQGNSSTGVSIMHTTSFNSLNPFSKKKKKSTKDKK